MIQHFYTKFDKSYFAALALKFAEGATKGDLLCLWLFQQAGIALASYILALWPSIDEVFAYFIKFLYTKCLP